LGEITGLGEGFLDDGVEELGGEVGGEGDAQEGKLVDRKAVRVDDASH